MAEIHEDATPPTVRGAERHSLASRHPRAWWVPVGIVAAFALLGVGLALPVMRVEKLVFWEDDYSIVTGAMSLWRDGHRFLSCVIVVFSIVFPIVKLAALLALWFTPMRDGRRSAVLRLVDGLGKWSMLDVFVVAVTVVLVSSKATLDATPRAGVYAFTGAVAASMVMTVVVKRRAAATPAPAAC